MGNAVKKKNSLVLLEEMIMNEQYGFVESFKNIEFIMTDIFKIKKILLQKSKEKTSQEREFYYRISVKINLKNYMEYFNILDKQFSKKRIESKKTAAEIKDKHSLMPRKSAEITIKSPTIPDFVKNKLKSYIYVHSSNDNTVSIYLRNKDEYKEKLSELKNIRDNLKNNNLNIKIYIIGGSKIIENMSVAEKNEFRNFLLSY